MKYVINGGIGTAITLFGMSYLYGITGSTNIVDMQKVFAGELAGGIQLLLALAFYYYSLGSHSKLLQCRFICGRLMCMRERLHLLLLFLEQFLKLLGSYSLCVCSSWFCKCIGARRHAIFIWTYEHIHRCAS